jgi:hypothetical protein
MLIRGGLTPLLYMQGQRRFVAGGQIEAIELCSVRAIGAFKPGRKESSRLRLDPVVPTGRSNLRTCCPRPPGPRKGHIQPKMTVPCHPRHVIMQEGRKIIADGDHMELLGKDSSSSAGWWVSSAAWP